MTSKLPSKPLQFRVPDLRGEKFHFVWSNSTLSCRNFESMISQLSNAVSTKSLRLLVQKLSHFEILEKCQNLPSRPLKKTSQLLTTLYNWFVPSTILKNEVLRTRPPKGGSSQMSWKFWYIFKSCDLLRGPSEHLKSNLNVFITGFWNQFKIWNQCFWKFLWKIWEFCWFLKIRVSVFTFYIWPCKGFSNVTLKLAYEKFENSL